MKGTKSILTSFRWVRTPPPHPTLSFAQSRGRNQMGQAASWLHFIVAVNFLCAVFSTRWNYKRPNTSIAVTKSLTSSPTLAYKRSRSWPRGTHANEAEAVWLLWSSVPSNAQMVAARTLAIGQSGFLSEDRTYSLTTWTFTATKVNWPPDYQFRTSEESTRQFKCNCPIWNTLPEKKTEITPQGWFRFSLIEWKPTGILLGVKTSTNEAEL